VRIAHIGPAVLPVGYSFGGAVERRMVELAAAQLHRGDILVVSLAPDLAEELIALCDDPAAPARLAAQAPGEASKFTWPAIADRAEKLLPRSADVITGAAWSV
jgi:hypothetical protein